VCGEAYGKCIGTRGFRTIQAQQFLPRGYLPQSNVVGGRNQGLAVRCEGQKSGSPVWHFKTPEHPTGLGAPKSDANAEHPASNYLALRRTGNAVVAAGRRVLELTNLLTG